MNLTIFMIALDVCAKDLVWKKRNETNAKFEYEQYCLLKKVLPYLILPIMVEVVTKVTESFVGHEKILQ